ncbi:MAG: ABC transporter permease [Dehalococcoidia bacterium]
MKNKLTIVARNEFWATVKRRSFIITTALFPAIGLLALAGFAIFQAIDTADDEPEATTVGYVDNSSLFTDVWQRSLITYEPVPDREAGVQALLAEDLDGLFVIPADYLATGIVERIQERQAGIPGFGGADLMLEQFLRENLVAGQVPPDLQERLLSPAVVNTVEVDPEGQPVDEPFDVGRIFFVLLSFLVLMSVFMSAGFFQEGLSEEKETRVMEILLSSTTPKDLMLGKLFGLAVVGLAQVAFWMVFATALIAGVQASGILDLPPELELVMPPLALLPVGLLYFVLGYLFFGALQGSLGAVTSSHREAQQMTVAIIMPGIVPFWFLAPVLGDPEGTLSRVLTFIPFTAPVTALLRMGIDGIGALDLAISLGILTVSTLLAVLLALRFFQAYLLMYGQRPGLRHMVRTVVKGQA